MKPSSERSFFVGLSIAESFALGAMAMSESLSKLLRGHRFPKLGSYHGEITQKALLYFYKTPLIETPQLPSIFEEHIKQYLIQIEPHYRTQARLNNSTPKQPTILSDALTLSAASFHFDDLDSLMPWAIQLLAPKTNNQRRLTGVVFLMAVIWGYQKSIPFEELLQHIQVWRKSSVAMQSSIPDHCWWQYEQALWILREVGLQPMLDFINTLNKDSNALPITQPSEQDLISIITYLINTAQHNAFVEGIEKIMKQTKSITAVATVGALIALRCQEEGVPFWMREQAKHRWIFENSWSVEKEKEWTLAWEDAYKESLSTTKPSKKAKKISTNKNQLKLF